MENSGQRVSRRQQNHKEPLLDLVERIICHLENLGFEPDAITIWDFGLFPWERGEQKEVDSW